MIGNDLQVDMVSNQTSFHIKLEFSFIYNHWNINMCKLYLKPLFISFNEMNNSPPDVNVVPLMPLILTPGCQSMEGTVVVSFGLGLSYSKPMVFYSSF